MFGFVNCTKNEMHVIFLANPVYILVVYITVRPLYASVHIASVSWSIYRHTV